MVQPVVPVNPGEQPKPPKQPVARGMIRKLCLSVVSLRLSFSIRLRFSERHTISQATVFQNTRFGVETEYSETVRLPYGTTIGAVSMAFCFVWLLGLPDHTNKTLC